MRRRALCALLIWFSKATKQLCSVILFCFRIGVSLQSMVCNSILLMRKLRHREVKWHGNTDSLSRRDLRINTDLNLEAKKFCFQETEMLKEIKLQSRVPQLLMTTSLEPLNLHCIYIQCLSATRYYHSVYTSSYATLYCLCVHILHTHKGASLE